MRDVVGLQYQAIILEGTYCTAQAQIQPTEGHVAEY